MLKTRSIFLAACTMVTAMGASQAAKPALSLMSFPPGEIRLKALTAELPAPAVVPAPMPAARQIPSFYSFWNAVIDRVNKKIEGTLESSGGRGHELLIYSIEREEAGVVRQVAVRVLTIWLDRRRYDDPKIEITVNFVRKEGSTQSVSGANGEGESIFGDRDEFDAQYSWWSSQLLGHSR